MARGAARSAVVAVEADPAAQRAPLGPQVALHALLARQVGVVRAELALGFSLVEGGRLHELGDLATHRRSACFREHGEARASLGQHTTAVLHELGIEDQDIASLRREKVI